MKPSAMMFRNLLAMQTEEMLRAQPVDAAVLIGGCDKTTPGVLMGAISANLPCIYLPAGAMLRGHYRGETVGSGTDVWRHWDEKRAGRMGRAQWLELEEGIARTAGTCMTMGTAATMMLAAEALGLSLPGAASIPAVDSHHRRLALRTGARAVALANGGVAAGGCVGPRFFCECDGGGGVGRRFDECDYSFDGSRATGGVGVAAAGFCGGRRADAVVVES